MNQAWNKVVGGWLLALTLCVVALAWKLWTAESGTRRFGTIAVERIDVVEPDGRPRLVLASRARFPGIIFEGKEYLHATRDTGGVLFFNSEGDEMGGLVFDGRKKADGYQVSGGMTFDHFKQDQTVVIRYDDENGRETAGFEIVDRPQASILPAIELHDRAAKAFTENERDAILAEKDETLERIGRGRERAFLGKVPDGSALLRLADTNGRPRILIAVGADGAPSITFLDEGGAVVSRLPAR